MATTHAKLYVTQSGYDNALAALEDALDIASSPFSAYCSYRQQVRSDHPEHADKYILPIEDMCRHLVSGEIPYDHDWHADPEPEPPE